MKLPPIVAAYYRDRACAETGDDKRRVWRMYARAVIETDTEHRLGVLPWRRAAGDDDLPIRFQPYWKKLPADDLKELWLALERARHRVSYE